MPRTLPLLTRRTAAAALALAAIAPAAFAQAPAYPTRPVTIVVPFAPGGGTDIAARAVANKLQIKWGQPVLVENRGGAGGLVGADQVAKAKPDGYTLLVGNLGTQSINPALYKKMPYDADKAFAPVALICDLPFVMLVRPNMTEKNVQEVVAKAKAQPGSYTFASSGPGGSPHLTGEMLQIASGAKLLHVPYKGGGPAMTDLMAGHVDMLFASALESVGFVKSGKLKAMAVTGKTRLPMLPDVPTVAESGYPGFDSGSWVAVLAPAGTPQAIVDKVSADVREAVNAPDIKQTLAAQGAIPHGSTPAELTTLINTERARYTKLITERGIKVE
jgi:tripartite-type tricarboxylate transporter receptor subunit TctC